MSEAPEKVWLKEGYNSWGQYGDWWYTAIKGDGVEYVRADRIAELEAKLSKSEALLAKAVWRLEQMRDDRIGYRHPSHYIRGAAVTLAELTKERSDEKGDKTQ